MGVEGDRASAGVVGRAVEEVRDTGRTGDNQVVRFRLEGDREAALTDRRRVAVAGAEPRRGEQVFIGFQIVEIDVL